MLAQPLGGAGEQRILASKATGRMARPSDMLVSSSGCHPHELDQPILSGWEHSGSPWPVPSARKRVSSCWCNHPFIASITAAALLAHKLALFRLLTAMAASIS